VKRPAVISEIAGRFPLDCAADAYRALESGAHGKVLVIPNLQSFPQDSAAPKRA
jgi:NADPH2:quinone reductase